MCTSIVFCPKDHYFGRNLDYEIDYHQKVVITPRNFPFKFRKMPTIKHHYALIGVTIVEDEYPLYFDAANEKGVGMAGLNFAGFTYYNHNCEEDKDNVSPFEFIAWILAQADSVADAKKLLKKINLIHIDFSKQMPLAELHYIIADKTGASVVVEAQKDGMHVYDNPVGVMTNSPEFPKQLTNLDNYADVSTQMPVNNFSKEVKFNGYSRGLGSRNLPGGVDSESRFVRVLFNKANAPKYETEAENVNSYFHILHSVEQNKNLDGVGDNKYEYTIYSDCANLDKGLFYYTTYEDKQIHQFDMYHENLDGDQLITYPMNNKPEFKVEN